MTIALLFWIFALGCCGYAACFGGWEGRWFALIYIIQSLLTVAAAMVDFRWSDTNWPTFAIDLALLIALLVLALRTTRFWPLWVLGLHYITVSAHLASMMVQTVQVQIYFLVATLWSIPKLAIVVIGIQQDRRAGLAASPHERGP